MHQADDFRSKVESFIRVDNPKDFKSFVVTANDAKVYTLVIKNGLLKSNTPDYKQLKSIHCFNWGIIIQNLSKLELLVKQFNIKYAEIDGL